jgi:hypothetical protein
MFDSGSKPAGRPSALVDTRVIYCGDNLEQLKKLPDLYAAVWMETILSHV